MYLSVFAKNANIFENVWVTDGFENCHLMHELFSVFMVSACCQNSMGNQCTSTITAISLCNKQIYLFNSFKTNFWSVRRCRALYTRPKKPSPITLPLIVESQRLITIRHQAQSL